MDAISVNPTVPIRVSCLYWTLAPLRKGTRKDYKNVIDLREDHSIKAGKEYSIAGATVQKLMRIPASMAFAS